MKKTITGILILILTMLFTLAGCQSSNDSSKSDSKSSSKSGGSDEVTLVGRWEYLNDYDGDIEYYEFNSDGTCVENDGSSSNKAEYAIDDDGTFHLYAGEYSDTLKLVTVDEILKMDDSQASSCYAYNEEVLYFMDNDREFKRK